MSDQGSDSSVISVDKTKRKKPYGEEAIDNATRIIRELRQDDEDIDTSNVNREPSHIGAGLNQEQAKASYEPATPNQGPITRSRAKKLQQEVYTQWRSHWTKEEGSHRGDNEIHTS
ncbi:hypothetical protein EJB05_33512, partial [Eragrostis curvula]